MTNVLSEVRRVPEGAAHRDGETGRGGDGVTGRVVHLRVPPSPRPRVRAGGSGACPRVFLFVLMLAAAMPVMGQQSGLTPLRLGETLLNLPTQRVLSPGGWEVRFTHRFATPINEGDEHNLWGLDGAADIGIGLAYSPMENLQLALYRTDLLDDIEASVKYALIRQERLPFSASIRAGVDWRTEQGVVDPVSGFAQLIVARQFGQKAEIFAMPTYVTETDLFENAFNVPVGFAWSITPPLSLIVELVPENRDLPESIDSSFGWNVGIKRAIGGHWFEVMVGNSRATHVDQYTPTTILGQGFDSGDLHLGFNIERRFGRSRRN